MESAARHRIDEASSADVASGAEDRVTRVLRVVAATSD
jgi:hypothetical protein